MLDIINKRTELARLDEARKTYSDTIAEIEETLEVLKIKLSVLDDVEKRLLKL